MNYSTEYKKVPPTTVLAAEGMAKTESIAASITAVKSKLANFFIINRSFICLYLFIRMKTKKGYCFLKNFFRFRLCAYLDMVVYHIFCGFAMDFARNEAAGCCVSCLNICFAEQSYLFSSLFSLIFYLETTI